MAHGIARRFCDWRADRFRLERSICDHGWRPTCQYFLNWVVDEMGDKWGSEQLSWNRRVRPGPRICEPRRWLLRHREVGSPDHRIWLYMHPWRIERGAIAILLFLGLTSCASWGPVEYAVGPFSYGTDATGLFTAIATNYSATQYRRPQAILGPAPKVDAAGALIWLCDANAKQVRSLGLVPMGAPIPNDTVLVADWEANTFVIHNPGTTFWFRVPTLGAASAVPPADSAMASQAITTYCSTELDSLRAVSAPNLTWNRD